MKKLKIDWKLIWSTYTKLQSGADYAAISLWRERLLIFVAVFNTVSKDRLSRLQAQKLETEFLKWMKETFVNYKFEDQKKQIKLIVEKLLA